MLLAKVCCACPWIGRDVTHGRPDADEATRPRPSPPKAWFFLGGASGAMLFPYVNIFLSSRGEPPC